ncbi:F-box/WD repeat-containing protein 2, partial [Goodea atripinnis]
VIKMEDPANLSLLSFGEVFALLFDNCFLYVMDLRTESISGRWPLPAYRKSKRGSSFLAGVTSWLNGLDGGNDSGLVFATSMPDHSIHLTVTYEDTKVFEAHTRCRTDSGGVVRCMKWKYEGMKQQRTGTTWCELVKG